MSLVVVGNTVSVGWGERPDRVVDAPVVSFERTGFGFSAVATKGGDSGVVKIYYDEDTRPELITVSFGNLVYEFGPEDEGWTLDGKPVADFRVTVKPG